jgi:hypothetical protein
MVVAYGRRIRCLRPGSGQRIGLAGEGHPAAEGNDSRSSAFRIFDIHLELASRLKPCQFRLCVSQLDEAWRTGVDRRREAALGFIPIVSFQVKSSQIKRNLASAQNQFFGPYSQDLPR